MNEGYRHRTHRGGAVHRNGPASDPWLKYEHQLRVEVPPTSFQNQLDKLTNGLSLHDLLRSRDDIFPIENSEEESMSLSQRLEHALTKNMMIADPYGVGDAMPPTNKWTKWAMDIATNCSRDRVKKLGDEYNKNCKRNKQTLNKLEKETREGYVGSRAYICALNFLLHDAFDRCGIPLPPGINLDVAVRLRGDPLYKAQMRSWRGYQMKVMGIIDIITCHQAREGGDRTSSVGGDFPNILLGERMNTMSSEVIHYLKRNEAKGDLNQYELHDNGVYGHLPTQHNDSRSQSSEYYSAEEDQSEYSEAESNSSGIERDLYRYPKGVQFYEDGGYDTANKNEDDVEVELNDGKKYQSEAIPDITLRASEGNLGEVRKIVQAAEAVSEHEKRATVNKARTWIKLNYNETKMCVLYDATALAYACLNGHHDVVQYLLEQGADPTLRGTIPPNWSVNARGAVHKLYGKIEQGKVPYTDMMLMQKCGNRCEELLLAARPFWRPAYYCRDDTYCNVRGTFNNIPSHIDELRLALKRVRKLNEHPPKRKCDLCRRIKSLNCFDGRLKQCHHCSDILKMTRPPSDTNTPSSRATDTFQSESASVQNICLVCCKKKSMSQFTRRPNECDDCYEKQCDHDGSEDDDEGESEASLEDNEDAGENENCEYQSKSICLLCYKKKFMSQFTRRPNECDDCYERYHGRDKSESSCDESEDCESYLEDDVEDVDENEDESEYVDESEYDGENGSEVRDLSDIESQSSASTSSHVNSRLFVFGNSPNVGETTKEGRNIFLFGGSKN